MPRSPAAPTACAPVRPTARYRLEIVTPSGSLWSRMAMNTITPASMNPAPKATKCSITWRPSAARRVTASAPTTLPSAATSAYSTALDTGEQVRLGVAGRILEHLGEQALQRLAYVGAGSHARGEEVVARDGEVLQRQGVLPLSHGAHGFGEKGEGSGTRRRQREQIIGVLTHLRQPLADRRKVLRVRILVTPHANRPASLDVLVRALEAREQRRGIGCQARRDEDGVARKLVDRADRTPPLSLLPDLREPDPRSPDLHPQRQQLGDACRRHDPLEPLVPHALGRELRQPLRVRLGGLERARVNPELEPRAEAQRPQDPQVILLKAPVGVAHGADQLALQVRRALEGILPAVRDGVVGDRVDRVVAPREIVHQRDAELHHGVPAIRPDVLAERRHLMGRAALVQHRDRTVLDPHGNRALEQAAHLVRRRRGRQIEIVVLETEQVVPDRPAHAPGLVAGVFQLLRYPEDFFRDWEAGRELHPTNCVGSGEWYQTVRPAAPVRTVAYHSPLPTPWFSHTAPFPR